ncbi:VOC family protein [bacterium]|nr:VOC family protein [bacterium]
MFNRFSAVEAQALSVDHIVIKVNGDFQQYLDQLEQKTGVKPLVYTINSDSNTQNAIIGLSKHSYLELSGSIRSDSSLASAVSGWAIKVDSSTESISSLKRMGFTSTEPQVNQRTRVDGSQAQWSSFGIRPKIQGQPFFLEWATDTKHPSQVAPEGCSLKKLLVSTPHPSAIRALTKTFGLTGIDTRLWFKEKLAITLTCPNGDITI